MSLAEVFSNSIVSAVVVPNSSASDTFHSLSQKFPGIVLAELPIVCNKQAKKHPLNIL